MLESIEQTLVRRLLWTSMTVLEDLVLVRSTKYVNRRAVLLELR